MCLARVDVVDHVAGCVTEDASRSTSKGYSELGQRDVADGTGKDESDSADSDDSDLDDTDSEFGAWQTLLFSCCCPCCQG